MVRLTVLPCALLPLLLNKLKIPDYVIVLIGLTLALAGSLIKLNYKYSEKMNIYQYFTGSVIFYAATLIAETAIVPTAIKAATPNIIARFWNAFQFLKLSDNLGRMTGNISFTVYSQFDRTAGKKAEPFYAYILDSSVLLLMIITVAVVNKRFEKHMEIAVVKE